MIHPATIHNQKAIEGLIRRQHAASKYAGGRVNISDKALHQCVFAMIGGQHQFGPGGTCCFVALHDGKVTGFIGGVLQRVYHVGDRLTAYDMFLVNEANRIGDTLALIDQFVAWAKNNKKVMEINVSWNDAIPGAERAAELYARKGFVKSGEMFEMRLDVPAEKLEGIAA